MGELPQASGAISREPGRARASLAPWLLIGAGVVVGIGAEATSFGLADAERWIPDLVVGWACIGCGALVATRQPGSWIGPILAIAGFTWFIGNFSGLPVAALAFVAAQLTLTHRALLIHAALTLPGGRTTGPLQLGVIVIGYLAWSIPATADVPVMTVALSALAALMAGAALLGAAPPARGTGLIGLAATVLLGGAFSLASIVHAAVPTGAADQAVLLIDEAAIVIVAGGLTLAMLLPRLRLGRLTDLVVEAAQSRSDGIRATLAQALGDPSLEIGYWHAASGRYLDASGEDVVLPDGTDDRAVLRVDLDDRPAAVIVHDPAALESSAITDAVRTTAILAAANARLRGDVVDQLTEVRASRRRLVLAADTELGRLERRVDRGPLRRSRDVATALAKVESDAAERGAAAVAERIGRARGALTQASAELEALAGGLHPAFVGTNGLSAALDGLAERSPLPIEVTCQADDLPEPIELAVYYACTEALANVVKHAHASVAQVRVWIDGSRVHLLVTDDGAGGADPGVGSGVRGIQDRIEALGGALSVTSETGSGTRLAAEIPLAIEEG